MRFWLYKCNIEGGPAGYWGDWRHDVFGQNERVEWGGHYATRSPEVARYLDEEVAAGDLIVAYQTNEKEIVGFCRVEEISGPLGDKKLFLTPVELLKNPLRIHEVKHGTVLEGSIAVNGPVMLRELDRNEVREVIRLSGASLTV